MVKRVALVGLMMIAAALGALPALAQDGENLSETFETNDRSLRLDHPAGWTAEEMILPGLVLLGSSPAAVETVFDDESRLAAEDVVLMIIGPHAISLVFDEDPPATMRQAAALLAESASGETGEVGELVERTLNGQPALSFPASGSQGDGVGVVIDFDGELVVVSAMAAPGEFEAFEQTVFAILDTLTYAVPEGLASFETEDGALTFEYPAAWQTVDLMEGSVFVTNDLAAFGENIAPGTVIVLINTPEANFAFSMGEQDEMGAAVTEFAELWVEGEGRRLADPVETKIGEQAAMRVDYTTPQSEGFALAVDYDGAWLLIAVTTAPDELADFEEPVMALLASIAYQPEDD